MVKSQSQHPWVLTGPWYRWARPGVPASGRVSAPVLQKYASPRFIEDFLREPQRSLKYSQEDFVDHIRGTGGSKYALTPAVLAATGLRKLFLDSHSRFYLVVCELHCDAPGLPSVSRDQVCEAGFVVRRRTIDVPSDARAAMQATLGAVGQAQLKLNLALAVSKKDGSPAFADAIARAIGDKQVQLAEELEQCRNALAELAEQYGLKTRVQGWIPAQDHRGLGAWKDVEENPETSAEEQVYRLFPLVPVPDDVGHSARRQTLFFGMVPTGSADTDVHGGPRFDDNTLYEVRCFVRRHKDCCPRQPAAPDCKGELVWSAPSECYQLAAHFDMDGTSHRPVTIRLPDLTELAVQASSKPLGKGMGLRIISPQSLELNGSYSGEQIGPAAACSYSIPLVTIVANFAFHFFLPVVVVAFRLYFLLRLKFCGPPSLSLDANLVAELEAHRSQNLDMTASLTARIDDALANKGGLLSDALRDLDANEKAGLILDMASGSSASVPSLIDGLEYYERLELPTP